MSQTNKNNRRRRPGSALPRVEALETRQLLVTGLPPTFTVTNIGDSGPGSLRQAIIDADAAPPVLSVGAAKIAIVFNIPGRGSTRSARPRASRRSRTTSSSTAGPSRDSPASR